MQLSQSIKSAKSLLIVGVIAIALLLSVGYSSISQDIREVTKGEEVTKEQVKELDVKIVKIEPKRVFGLASAGVPSFTNNSATFNADLMRAGDNVKYEVTLKNNGTKTAVLDNILLEEQYDGSPALIYNFTTPAETLEPGSYTTLTVEANYDPMFLEAPEVTSKVATLLVEYSLKG